jgi:hypothetical protein
MTTKRQVELDDNESLNPRFRTLGDRIFGNLSYLPSSSRLPNNEADDKIDPVAEKSGHDENNEHQTPWYGMMPQPSPAKIPWLLKNLEMAIEEKLRQVDADKTIGDTKQSVVELIRTSSSASTRSFKGKRTLVLLILNANSRFFLSNHRMLIVRCHHGRFRRELTLCVN